ncbi:MAG: hypothetical protein ACE15D_09245 [Candidatus Eisenbacteria bacterium]
MTIRARRLLHVLAPPALAALTLAGGCGSPTVSSLWLDRAIVVDGSRADWKGLSVYKFEDEKVFVGVGNDDSSLYLLLGSSEKALIAQELRQGLRVRFRPEKEGKQQKDAGLWIGCPRALGMGGRNGPRGAQRPAEEPPEEGGRGGRGLDEDRILAAIRDMPKELQVFSQAGEDSLILSWDEAARRGIEAKAGYEDAYYLVEMKVPLRRDAEHPQAIGIAAETAERVVDVSLQVRKPEGGFRERPEGGGRGGPGGPGGAPGGFSAMTEGREAAPVLAQSEGGFPGGGRDGDMFPGGRRGGRSFSMPEGLDVSMKIRLANGEAGAQ